MTDERRQEDRRGEDLRLAEEVSKFHDALDERFDKEWIKANEAHAQLAHKDHEHPEIARLVRVLEGEAVTMPSGRVHYEGGLIAEVAKLTKKLSNGGIRIKIPWAAWAAIIAAIIAGGFNVWAAMAGAG